MKTILFILLFSPCVFSQISIDSLMKQNIIAEMKAGRVTGYVFSHGQRTQLIPPNKLFHQQPDYTLPEFSVNVDNQELQREVNDLKIEMAKTSYILESLIKQSESHSKNNEFLLKLLEIIIGGIVSIIAAVIVAKFTSKKPS